VGAGLRLTVVNRTRLDPTLRQTCLSMACSREPVLISSKDLGNVLANQRRPKHFPSSDSILIAAVAFTNRSGPSGGQ